jgi:hypothetical protein
MHSGSLSIETYIQDVINEYSSSGVSLTSSSLAIISDLELFDNIHVSDSFFTLSTSSIIEPSPLAPWESPFPPPNPESES